MIATFRETLKSVQDKNYGAQIIHRPTRAVLWYLGRYVLLLSILPLMLVIILATYFVPQLPGLIREHVPDGYLSLKDNLLDTSLPPAEFSAPDAVFQFAPQDPLPEKLDSLPTGLHVFQDGLVSVEGGGSFRLRKYTDLPNFYLDKAQVLSWLTTHTSRFWLILIVASLAVWLVTTSLFYSFKISSLLLWAVLFWFFVRLLKRPLPYLAAFKLAVYAAAPTLIISAILFIAPQPFLSWLNLGVFLFLIFSWAWNLPKPSGPSKIK